jgi:hypothetical protein
MDLSSFDAPVVSPADVFSVADGEHTTFDVLSTAC